MKQVWFTRFKGPGALEVREVPAPAPAENMLTVAVKAAGINFADLLSTRGLYPDAPKFPCVMGYEIAGTVEAVGAGIDKSWLGKEIFSITAFGGLSEKINIPLDLVFEKPADWSFEEAAAFPVNYHTAYALTVVVGSLKKGETVLIHNAGGGMGLAILQIARKIGAVTLGTASTHKHAFLKEQGLDHAIDYHNQDWEKEVLGLTQQKGVELILDPVGGAYWKKNYRLLRTTGRLGIYGFSSIYSPGGGRYWPLLKLIFHTPFFIPLPLFDQNRGVFGINMGHYWHEKPMVNGWTKELLQWTKEGWIKPRVDKTFPFAQAVQAFQYIEQRRNMGKVLLTA